MSIKLINLDSPLEFLNGRVPMVSETGQYRIFGSNGPIGYSEEYNHESAVILGRVGAYCGSVEISDEPFWASDNTIVIKPKKYQSLQYWYYKLKTLSLRSYAGGAAQPLITHGILRSIQTKYHEDLNQQNHIAYILSAYDDLINTNRRRLALLEEAARQLYQEWFVRLRFPGHEHTPIVEGLPEGWEETTLGDLCTDIRETVLPDQLELDTPYIGLEHMPRRSISLSEWGKASDVTSTKHRFRNGEILFGKIRPYFHKVGVAFIDGVASSDIIVIRPNMNDFFGLLLLLVSSDSFVASTSQSMREGSKMPRADWKLMKQYPLLLPPHDLLQAFNVIIQGITEQLKTLTFQNQKLRAARDLLLPRLMSGEITV